MGVSTMFYMCTYCIFTYASPFIIIIFTVLPDLMGLFFFLFDNLTGFDGETPTLLKYESTYCTDQEITTPTGYARH